MERRIEKWELVTLDDRGAGHTYRLAVPGGWLYRTTTYRYPELHQSFDRLDKVRRWRITDHDDDLKAVEIASQNTVFVTGLDAALRNGPTYPTRETLTFMYGKEVQEMLDETVGY